MTATRKELADAAPSATIVDSALGIGLWLALLSGAAGSFQGTPYLRGRTGDLDVEPDVEAAFRRLRGELREWLERTDDLLPDGPVQIPETEW